MKSLILIAALLGQAPAPQKAAAPVPATIPAPVAPVIPATSAPGIAGATTIPEHTLTSYSVPGFDAVSWLVIPAISIDTNGGKLDITGPPGSYTILAAIVQDGKPVILSQILTVQATPVPSTVATPTPQVSTAVGARTPAPGLWAFATFDLSSKTQWPPGQLAVFNSQTIGPALKALGVHYKVVTTANQPGAPSLHVLDATGKSVIGPELLPADEAAVIAEIQGKVPK